VTSQNASNNNSLLSPRSAAAKSVVLQSIPYAEGQLNLPWSRHLAKGDSPMPSCHKILTLFRPANAHVCSKGTKRSRSSLRSALGL
jgi:hypothetical protein